MTKGSNIFRDCVSQDGLVLVNCSVDIVFGYERVF